MSQNPPVLHLALPGLLWPAAAIRDLVFDLQLPALSWLLGKGTRQLRPVADAQQWLAAVAGLSTLPAAALRINRPEIEQTGRWLCLDPIHLRVERSQLIVEDPVALQLTATEAEALHRDLAPLLEELGELRIDSPHEWHLHLREAAAIRTTPLANAIGLNGEQMMPRADNVKVWRRLLNEVQVTLHAHPVNLARSERGLPTVNSLWPWGEGTLDFTHKPEWTNIQADGALWQGLSRHLGCKGSPLPQRFTSSAGKTLIVHPALENAARSHDAMQWLNAMQALEQNWFAPMQLALQQGQLKALVLHGLGGGMAMTVTVTSSAGLRFWRKPVPLTVLGVGNDASTNS